MITSPTVQPVVHPVARLVGYDWIGNDNKPYDALAKEQLSAQAFVVGQTITVANFFSDSVTVGRIQEVTIKAVRFKYRPASRTYHRLYTVECDGQVEEWHEVPLIHANTRAR